MRTIRTKLYTFTELSPKVQEKVLSDQRDINLYHGWEELLIAQFKLEQQGKGFDVDKVFYTGFYSQGDGAMFEGVINSYIPFMQGVYPAVQNLIQSGVITIECTIRHMGYYYNERNSRIDLEWEAPKNYVTYPNVSAEIEKIEHNIVTAYYKTCKDFYKLLETEYNALTSNANVRECILENGYEFHQTGELYKG